MTPILPAFQILRCFVVLVSCSLTNWAVPQIDEIQPDVVYQTEDAQSLVQIEKLMQAKNWNQTAPIIDEFLTRELKSTVSFPISDDSRQVVLTSPNLRDYANFLISGWFTKNPEALAAYQQYVASNAEIQFEGAQQDLENLERFVDRFTFSKQGSNAVLMLGDFYYLHGRVDEARQCWRRLLEVEPSKNESKTNGGNLLEIDIRHWKVPGSSIAEADVQSRLLMLDIVTDKTPNVSQAIDQFDARWPNATFELNGKTMSWSQWLRNQFTQAESINGSEDPEENKFDTIDNIAMRTCWTARVNSRWNALTDRIAAVCLPVGRTLTLRQRIKPLVTDSQIIWHDGKQIRSLDIENGTPTFTTGTEWDQDPAFKGTVWRSASDQEVTGSAVDDRAVGIPEFGIVLNGTHLFARVGDPLIAAGADKTQSSSAIVGLDLTREGRVLPGFPLQPPDPSYEFLGRPIINDSGIYVALQKSIGTQIEIYVAQYDGKIAGAGQPAFPRWMTFVVKGETYGQYCAGSCSRNVITDTEGSILFGGILGTIGSIKKSDGRIQWLIRYPRHPLVTNVPGHQMLNYFRTCEPVLIRASNRGQPGNKILVLPIDHPDVFCIDVTSGHIEWRTEIPDARWVLGADEKCIYLSGDRLYWIDRFSGNLVTSYPGYHGIVPLGDARNANRGVGKGLVSDKLIAFPTSQEIILFDRELSKDHQTGTLIPRIVRTISLQNSPTQVSELQFQRGRLLVIGDTEIKALK